MKYLLTLSLLLNPFHVWATAFDLFDSERGTVSNIKKNAPKTTTLPIPFRARTKTTNKKKKLRPQKDFTLIGTSRFGNKRIAVLKGFDNKTFIQRFKNNTRTALKDYEGYYLLSVKARQVTIEYPEEAPCRQDKPKKGLECNADATATLNLKYAKAMTQPRKSTPSRKTEKKSKPKRRKIIKKVIKDEEAPPGMRVVHTPFGDRLVPIK